MSLSTTSGEYLTAMGKAVPPVAVTSVTAAGYSLQNWVLAATLLYTLLQTVLLIYRFFKGRDNGGE